MTIARQHDELSSIGARNMGQIRLSDADITTRAIHDLRKIGVCLDSGTVNQMVAAQNAGFLGTTNGVMDADAFVTPLTTPSVTTPVQFLQAWLPGFINIITAVRKIDDLIGIVTQGSWEDEEVVQGILERTGSPVPYTDIGNTPMANWNVNYERFTVVRFEEGISVGRLEEARASRIRVSSGESKRQAAGEALEIQRNKIGFFGYNDGANRTYGFFNAPGLPTAVAAGQPWSASTFLEIIAEIRGMVQRLRTLSDERVSPETENMTLALPTSAVDYLSTVSSFGQVSVRKWLTDTYPKIRVVSAPELNTGNGGVTTAYLYAESVADSGTDDNRTWAQVVPNKFLSLGVSQNTKSYEEAYSNATAGVILKRPYALQILTGL